MDAAVVCRLADCKDADERACYISRLATGMPPMLNMIELQEGARFLSSEG